MKSCPTCNRTFEDTFTFCLADGSLLDAPFDPHATPVIPEPRQTEPPPTEVLQLDKETKQKIPPTISSPQPYQKPQGLVSTIASPAPVLKSPQLSPSPAQPLRKSHRRLWMTVGILVLITGAAIFFITRETASKHAKAGIKLENESKSESKFRDAEAEWRQAVKLEPNNDEWHWRLGFNLAEQQKYAEAEAEYRKAVQLKPDNYYYHGLFGEVLEKQEKYAEAEAEYREVIRLEPSYTFYQSDLDRVLAHQGKPKSLPNK